MSGSILKVEQCFCVFYDDVIQKLRLGCPACRLFGFDDEPKVGAGVA